MIHAGNRRTTSRPPSLYGSGVDRARGNAKRYNLDLAWRQKVYIDWYTSNSAITLGYGARTSGASCALLRSGKSIYPPIVPQQPKRIDLPGLIGNEFDLRFRVELEKCLCYRCEDVRLIVAR